MTSRRRPRGRAACVLASLAAFACTRQDPSAGIDTRAEALPAHAVSLDSLELNTPASANPRAWPGWTPSGNPLRIGGVEFARGVGARVDTAITLALQAAAQRFVAEVGVDDEAACAERGAVAGAARFRVVGDGRTIAETGALRAGDPPQRIDVDVTGVRVLRLVAEDPAGGGGTPVDWGGATLVLPSAHSWRPSITSVAGLRGEAALGAAAVDPSVRLSEHQLRHVETGRGPQHGAWLETLAGSLAGPADADAGVSAGRPTFRRRADGQPLLLVGRRYPRGFSLRGDSAFSVNLGARARTFVARVGVDGAFDCGKTAPDVGAHFSVWVDGLRAFDSGLRRPQEAPVNVLVDLAARFPGARRMTLVTRVTGSPALGATWAGAVIELGAGEGAPPTLHALEDPRAFEAVTP